MQENRASEYLCVDLKKNSTQIKAEITLAFWKRTCIIIIGGILGFMEKIKYFLILIIILSAISCSNNIFSGKIDEVLHFSGKNKSELVKAIRYFQAKGDSLQLDALLFLTDNLPHHSYYTIVPCDSEQVEIPWNISEYENYAEAWAAKDSLKKINGFEWKLGKRIEDAQNISADFLIKNVEDAFWAWRNLPWSKDYSYEIFKEYILPYRGSNEPLPQNPNWRKELIDKYSPTPEELSVVTDPVEAATLINQELRSWFRFDEIYYLHPTDQGVDEMMTTCKGRCEDMANLAIAVMRANGIAVTSDYTPYWATSGNNHAWNAIITQNGKAIPFMGCEADPGKYSIPNRIAKVYRKTFARQTDNLASLLKDNETVPAWLGSTHYLDVTDNYTKTADVDLQLNREIPDSARFAYLCVFNSGEWKAIQWSLIKKNYVSFQNMGVNLCYLPILIQDQELVPISEPIILQKNGTILHIRGNRSLQDMILFSTTQKKIAYATEVKQITALKDGAEYELFYWQDGWHSVGKQVATTEPLKFENVPADRLYWLVETSSNREERIFTYENGRQIWW